MREIFRYKAKRILYNTGEIQEDPVEENAKPIENKAKHEEELTAEQMNIVLGSMSDNRISDNVKDLAAHAAGGASESSGEQLTDEQMSIVLGSMSDNRISDNVKDLVAQNS